MSIEFPEGEGEWVPKKELNYLRESARELELLEAYGVDNWIGYSDALNDVEGYGML